MPKPFQIVPGYLHPHVMTVINDNSIFTDEVAPPEEPVRSLHFIVSNSGRDGVFLQFDTEPAAREEYGLPSFRQHGQPIYNMYETLKSGQSRVSVMRIMPDDASYANVVILAKVKTMEGGTQGAKKMEVKFVGQSISDLTKPEDFSTQVALLAKMESEQSDGYFHVPVAAVRVAGRGVYGNDFRIRFTESPEENIDSPYSYFRLEVLKVDGSLIRKETHVGTGFYDAHVGNKSLYMEDIVNDNVSGSKIVKMELMENNLKWIYDKYKEECVANTTLELANFDFLFGKNHTTGKAIDDYKVDVESDGLVLNKVEGITMGGGADGKFEYTESKLVQRETDIKDAYINAMSGKTSKVVNSKAQMPIDVIFDAAHEKDVKKALIALILRRKDAFGYIDGGIISSVEDALQWAKEFGDLGDRLFSKEFQHGMVRDSYTGKKIPLTTTWFLAGKLPVHIKLQGRHIPFQGERFALVTGYLKNTILPVIDIDDLDTKEQFYKLQCNYYETIAENTVIRGTAGTSQKFFSDLSEEHNMLVLLDIKRDLERLVNSKRYNFAEAEDRQTFTEEGQRLVAPRRGVQCREIDIYFDMNKWEEERSIIHCYAAVVFRTIAKRGIIEIDINKRV